MSRKRSEIQYATQVTCEAQPCLRSCSEVFSCLIQETSAAKDAAILLLHVALARKSIPVDMILSSTFDDRRSVLRCTQAKLRILIKVKSGRLM